MCTFDKYDVIVFHEKDKSLMFKGFRYRHIYLVDFSEKEACSMTCIFSKTSLGWVWHRRIAHIGMGNLKKAHKKGMITGLKDVTFDKNKLCSACQAGKQVVIHHPLRTMLFTFKPLKLPHMDLFGPTSYKSIKHPHKGKASAGKVFIQHHQNVTDGRRFSTLGLITLIGRWLVLMAGVLVQSDLI
jgi:hypothetical protein